MLRSTKKRLWIVLSGLGLLLAASVLTACTVSVSGGIAGVISALALGAALLGLGASTSGCEDDVGPCLTVDVGTCLSIANDACLSMDVGACLSPPIDAGVDGAAAEVGPCLQPPLPDAGLDAASPDAHIGPCLSPRPPDSGNLDTSKPDTKVGPCLSPPPLPLGALEPELRPEHAPALESRDNQRAVAIARLAARLPRDVAARLVDQGDDGNS